jgi:hypothetical protein
VSALGIGVRDHGAAGRQDHQAAVRERGRERARRTTELARLRAVAHEVVRLTHDVAMLDPADLLALEAALTQVKGDRHAERDLGVLPGGMDALRHVTRALRDLRAETTYAQRHRDTLLR